MCAWPTKLFQIFKFLNHVHSDPSEKVKFVILSLFFGDKLSPKGIWRKNFYLSPLIPQLLSTAFYKTCLVAFDCFKNQTYSYLQASSLFSPIQSFAVKRVFQLAMNAAEKKSKNTSQSEHPYLTKAPKPHHQLFQKRSSGIIRIGCNFEIRRKKKRHDIKSYSVFLHDNVMRKIGSLFYFAFRNSLIDWGYFFQSLINNKRCSYITCSDLCDCRWKTEKIASKKNSSGDTPTMQRTFDIARNDCEALLNLFPSEVISNRVVFAIQMSPSTAVDFYAIQM